MLDIFQNLPPDRYDKPGSNSLAIEGFLESIFGGNALGFHVVEKALDARKGYWGSSVLRVVFTEESSGKFFVFFVDPDSWNSTDSLGDQFKMEDVREVFLKQRMVTVYE
mgnify:CR=1 FL=1